MVSEPVLAIKEKVKLAPFTTLKIGGEAEYFLVAKTEEEIKAGADFACARALPIVVLGGGSNVLVSDEVVAGLIIKNELLGIEYQTEGDNVFVTVGAGVVWDDLVRDTVERGLWGLENLSAIPGSVGAVPVQNVGAYGVEAGELITKVRAYDLGKDVFVEFGPDECQFGYRDSFFKTKEGRRFVITAVTFKLSTEPKPLLHYKDLSEYFSDTEATPTLAEIRSAVIDIRKRKFPDLKEFGTAGSFFKNPVISKEEAEALSIIYPELPLFPQTDGRVKVSLGYILDKICDLRGFKEGRVGLFERQALVLINHGGANATEVETFAKEVAEKVFEKTKIKIEWEVNKI